MTHTKLERPSGHVIAYNRLESRNASSEPEVLFLPGFHSDMNGTKAMALRHWAERTGRTYTRFDYFGHGASSGTFTDGTISQWADDATAVIENVTRDPLLLVGSSMGGWISLLMARKLTRRIAGMLLIAPAPDFTEELMLPAFTPEMKAELARTGRIMRPSEYDEEPYEISQRLIDDGRNNLVLSSPLNVPCPIRILHGMKDPDVPWQHALKVVDAVSSQDVAVTFIKDGDHRLSRPQDLALLERTLETLISDIVKKSRQ